MKKIGALWNGKSKATGKAYKKGNVEVVAGIKTPVIIMANDEKKPGTKSPDAYIFLCEPKKEGEGKIKDSGFHSADEF